MDLDQLVHRHPRLFHMAAAGTWPSVREHGLLPTRTIVTTSGLPAPEQEQLLGARERVALMTVRVGCPKDAKALVEIERREGDVGANLVADAGVDPETDGAVV